MSKKGVSLIGTVTILTMLVLAIIFFKQRVVFLDISFHLFSILKDDNFAIQNNRIGAFFTQLFPLVGSKFGLPLNSLALLYSSSFIILPFITFLTLTHLIKNYKLAVAYLIFVVAMTTHTFYWIQSELPQAIAFLFLFFGMLEITLSMKKIPFSLIALGLPLLVLICFTHPLASIAFFFCCIYYFLTAPVNKIPLYTSFIAFSVLLIIKNIFFKTAYDSQAMNGINNLFKLLPNLLSLQSSHNFLSYLLKDYYIILVLFCINTCYFIYTKNYIKLSLVLLFTIGYIIVVNTNYPDGTDQFYLENQYLLLALFNGLPFVYDVMNNTKVQKFSLTALSLICVLSLLRIYQTNTFYTNRLNWVRHTIASVADKKVILNSNYAPLHQVLNTWGSCYEFWLLSTMEKGYSNAIIIEERAAEFDDQLPGNNKFITKWGGYDYAILNKKYFIFTDTSAYLKIKL
jgi:hypothetical protein